MSLSQTSTLSDDRNPETSSITSSGGFAVPPPPPPPVAIESRASTHHDDKTSFSQQHSSQLLSTDERFSQSDPRSAEGSQASNATSTFDRVFTPTPSDDGTTPNELHRPAQDSQLLQLSAIAATQDRMETDGSDMAADSRKRMADGEVKSPGKGHSRTTSTLSMASTTSTIGDLSHELRTRLSYAMVKVNNGWQAHSLDEVESLASQAVSPTSSTSTTVHRRSGSSASPQLTSPPVAQVHPVNEHLPPRRKSNSPPNLANRPTLAPPAPIRPSVGAGALNLHPRRNSNTHYTPTLLSHSHFASPHTPGPTAALNTAHGRSHGTADTSAHPSHASRDWEAIETLTNLKHGYSPTGSPVPSSQPTSRSMGRQPLPGGPRRALPTQRPPGPAKRVGFDASPGRTPVPGSPMDLDSPNQPYSTPNRGTPRRRTGVGGGHFRSALSLPSALGISHMTHRQPISDKDIDQMLDRGDEDNNSSDDEEIQLPPRRNAVLGAIRG
ncbi:hypothetical protein ACRE_060960 [Hapsidospora chrysogenum ATCC 11550]|uniref:Uncharacterized protein n=1 Tax=Hapsidospora chrysogenum (strain ATCC 11550 / CBS 779.69 / DSM 880 / IAM 14645 / JCM 23072 / IMI 49137) TaxID=857340 RepID=A0A086T1C3_HAPC1|nr:hypothetical protein ACRE_060960 [Hapsidospora chrysogenum ATCC 11550]